MTDQRQTLDSSWANYEFRIRVWKGPISLCDWKQCDIRDSYFHHEHEKAEGDTQRDVERVALQLTIFQHPCILVKFPLLGSTRWCLYLQPKER